MPSVTAVWRVALALGILAAGAHALETNIAGLGAPGGSSSTSSGARACRSVKLCHNSKGSAWTTVQVFTALEPLMAQLQLEAATDYVEVVPLHGCLSSGCCCSTPVEVRVSVPVHADAKTAAAQLEAVAEFIQYKLPRTLQDTVCTGGALGHCAPAIAAERKLLRKQEDDDMPPLPEGLVPYDGKKPLPGVKEEPADDMPQLPAGLVPYDGKRPLPGVKEAPAKPAEPAEPQLPAGLVPYDGRNRQLLLQEAEDALAASEAAIAAVPAMPAGASSFGGASVLESARVGEYGGRNLLAGAAPGTYGGRNLLADAVAGAYGGAAAAGRNLLAEMEALAGGYGGRNLLADGAAPGSYGGGAGRGLLADSLPGTYGAAGRNLLADMELAGGYGGRNLLADGAVPGGYGGGAGRNLLAEPAVPKKKQEQKREQPKKAPEAKKGGSGGAAKPAAKPTSAKPASTSAKPASASAARAAGTCYCRYNPLTASWSLEQAACRAALFKRCGKQGSMLECDAVRAFYDGLGMPGTQPPHRDTLSAFLFVDCPPAPPCSCRSVVDGGETPTARARCCADLKAHCQVPFSGLDCEHVARFCHVSGGQPSDPVGALFSYVLVKTHGQDCASPRFAAAYASGLLAAGPGGRPLPDEAAVRMLAKAAVLEGLARDGSDSNGAFGGEEADRVAAMLTMLVGGLFAVAVAAVGVGVLLRLGSPRQHAAPLLA